MAELLEFVAELYARKAMMANATLSVSKSNQAVTITTSPFVLETVVGRGLDIALASTGDGGSITLEAERADRCVRVKFGGLAGVTEPIEYPQADQAVTALLDMLGANFRGDPSGTAVFLEIPDNDRP